MADAATINGSAGARLFGDITDVPACVHGEALTDIVLLNVFGIDSWCCPVTIWSISNIFLSRAVHISDTGPPLHLLFRALPWLALWCEHNLLFITLGQLWPTVVVCIRLRKKALWPHLKPHLQPPWVVLQCLPTSFAKDAASSAWCQSYQRYASKCTGHYLLGLLRLTSNPCLPKWEIRACAMIWLFSAIVLSALYVNFLISHVSHVAELFLPKNEYWMLFWNHDFTVFCRL